MELLDQYMEEMKNKNKAFYDQSQDFTLSETKQEKTPNDFMQNYFSLMASKLFKPSKTSNESL